MLVDVLVGAREETQFKRSLQACDTSRCHQIILARREHAKLWF